MAGGAGGQAARAEREVLRWFIPVATVCASRRRSAHSSRILELRFTTCINDQYPIWDRKNQTAAALRMIQARPLFGFGWNNYANTAVGYFRASRDYPLTGYPSSINQQATGSNGQITSANLDTVTGALHNSYLSYAVELGLVGAVLWLASVLWGLGSAVSSRGSSELRPWRLGFLLLSLLQSAS